MLADNIIHDLHKSAEMTMVLSEGKSEEDRRVAKYNAGYEWRMAAAVNNAVRYWLDIRQVERFRAARFPKLGFPPLVHDSLFVEFNGLLEFDFRPWQRPDVVVGKDEEDMLSRVPKLKPREFTAQGPTLYKGVFIQHCKPPHVYLGWPKDENVVRVWWWEKPRHVLINEAEDKRVEGRTFPILDNFVITFCPSSWPNLLDTMRVMASDEEAHPGEMQHRQRLFNTTANLLYFLAAENVVRVKIRPEHHERHGRDLAGLPKSDREYHVLPFQLPRYRYLHKDSVETGRHVSVCFDVRGHFRHLRDERFERNEDGTERVVWIAEHHKGVGNPYQPSVRRGTIDSMFLDYDKFIREEIARVARRKDKT